MKQSAPDPASEMPADVARLLGLDGDEGAACRAKLETYVATLVKWQRRINLIGPATVADIWHRHILDCGQLAALVPAEMAETGAEGYDIITARALAPLPKLLEMSNNLLKTGGKLLFLKGKGADAELTESEKAWKMRVTKMPSASDSEGVILLIEDLKKRHG